MLGMVILRYINLPMSLQHAGISSKSRLLSWHNLTKWSDGVLAGLYPRNNESTNRSMQYFLWKIKIPCLECATSNPKPYLSTPRSLILKALCRIFFMCWIQPWNHLSVSHHQHKLVKLWINKLSSWQIMSDLKLLVSNHDEWEVKLTSYTIGNLLVLSHRETWPTCKPDLVWKFEHREGLSCRYLHATHNVKRHCLH